MALSNIAGWNEDKQTGTACGTECGASEQPAEKPAACGTACGASEQPAEKPAACGTACGASEQKGRFEKKEAGRNASVFFISVAYHGRV